MKGKVLSKYVDKSWTRLQLNLSESIQFFACLRKFECFSHALVGKRQFGVVAPRTRVPCLFLVFFSLCTHVDRRLPTTLEFDARVVAHMIPVHHDEYFDHM